jgi:hypothetical protein
MGNINKAFILLIILLGLTISNSIIIQPICAQVGVTKPSIPAFDVTLQTYRQYIPPTYGVDSSTGKAVIIKEGYTEVQKWVRVEIGGQPFLRYNNSDGQLISLFYNVRWKGDHDMSWQYIPQNIHYRDAAEPWDTQAIGCLISLGFKGVPKGPVSGWMELLDPNATQIDFQVEALIGYYTADDVFIGQSSGWSNTQTLNVSDGSTSTNLGTTSPSSSNLQQTGNFDWEQIAIILLGVTVIVLAFTLVLSRRRSAKQIQALSNSSVPQ